MIAGRALVAGLPALAMTALLLAIGLAAFGAHLPGRTAPALLRDVVLGAAVFCCLGFAVTSFGDPALVCPVVDPWGIARAGACGPEGL